MKSATIPHHAPRLLAAAVILLLVPAPASARSWTNADGRKIDAEIVSATASHVVLKLSTTGKNYTVPLTNLSSNDNAFVAEWLSNPSNSPTKLGKNLNVPDTQSRFENWDAEWPELISGAVTLEIDTVEENETEKRFVYHSPHYEYVCDVKLSKNVVKRFAVMFEATHEFVGALPLSMQKAHDPDERHRILLFESKSDYVKNGGPPDSAGVYIGGKDVIMVPLTSLGVEKGAGGYRVDYDKSNKTLPHEIVHQITDAEYFQVGARGWFTEGLADYVAVTPYRSGKFTVRGNQNPIKEYVTAYGRDDNGGRALGETIRLPDLKEFMLMPYSEFTANGSLNYGSSLLIVFYLFHWDGDEDAANVKSFLKALKEGKKGEEALAALLGGRSFDQLEADIAKGWRARGIKFDFK